MTDWSTVPVFGTPTPGSVVRPSAYAVITDDRGCVAIVRTPRGTYLPGGGQDPGESGAATAARETLEECGLIVRIGDWRAHAIEHLFSTYMQTLYEKHNTFCDATVNSASGEDGEADHELLWTPLREAPELLSPLSHRWAVREWERKSNVPI
jgi:8-oxo-dGTP diphosphatase